MSNAAPDSPVIVQFFLFTAHGDLVSMTLCEKLNMVKVMGAERSMGVRWADGLRSRNEARLLFDLILEGGGRRADDAFVATISKIVDDAKATEKIVLNNMLEEITVLKETIKDKEKQLERVWQDYDRLKEAKIRAEQDFGEFLHREIKHERKQIVAHLIGRGLDAQDAVDYMSNYQSEY